MKYDLIVLGGGPAGYLAAERAGHAGLKVLCIEEVNLGGVCLNQGCIPTKTLLYSAKLLDSAKNGEKYGLTLDNVTLDHSKVIERKNKVIKALVSGVKSALKSCGVDVVNARGLIKSKTNEGFVVEAGSESYIGERLLIATGSSPAVPPIPGLKESLDNGFANTNKEALDLMEAPKKLVVIGGGVIGLELASYYNSIGTEVVVIEMLDHIAGENDAELVSLLQSNMESKGIRFILSAKVTELSPGKICYEQNGESVSLSADKVLLSIGRRPNISDTGLDSIGVFTERGGIVVNDRMLTNIQNVYAAGDVTGQSMLAHTAYREAEVAINNIMGVNDRMRYNAIPAVLYTNPELSSVGETEATARAKGLDIEVVKISMLYSGRYIAENEGGNGVCKLIRDKKTNTLIGVHALSNYSSEFIVTAGTFIERELSIDQIRKIVFPHPTVAEILREGVWQFKI